MRVTLISLVLVLFAGGLASTSQPAPAAASLSGPMSGGKGQPFAALTAQDLAASHYSEAEYFLSGTSQAFEKAGAWGMDGRWAVAPAGRADYKIRMLVRRPSDPRRFNGVLIVEWLNVTAMSEGAADYMQMKEEIERSGYA